MIKSSYDKVTFKDGRQIPKKYDNYIDRDMTTGDIFIVDNNYFKFTQFYKDHIIKFGLSWK